MTAAMMAALLRGFFSVGAVMGEEVMSEQRRGGGVER